MYCEYISWIFSFSHLYFMQLNGKIIVLCMVLRVTRSTTADMPDEVTPNEATPRRLHNERFCPDFINWDGIVILLYPL